MGWETRGSSNFYYRKRRVGGRVISEYVGAGAMAELQARFDETDRDLAHLERQRRRQEQEAERAISAEIDRAGDCIRALVAAALLAGGYHRHKGQWRRKRDRSSDAT